MNSTRTIRIFKVIFYPMGAALQFFVLPRLWMALPIAAALLGLAMVNLSKLLDVGRYER